MTSELVFEYYGYSALSLLGLLHGNATRSPHFASDILALAKSYFLLGRILSISVHFSRAIRLGNYGCATVASEAKELRRM